MPWKKGIVAFRNIKECWRRNREGNLHTLALVAVTGVLLGAFQNCAKFSAIDEELASFKVSIPQPTLTLKPDSNSLVNHARIEFEFTDEDLLENPSEMLPVTFECRLRTPSFSPCQSPFEVQDLPDGEEYLFEVRAAYANGTYSEPMAHLWRVEMYQVTGVDAVGANLVQTWPGSDLLLFTARPEGGFEQLWATNGQTQKALTAIHQGEPTLSGFRFIGDHIYFSQGSGAEAWASDGTEGGTQRLGPIRHALVKAQGKMVRERLAAADSLSFTSLEPLYWVEGAQSTLLHERTGLGGVVQNGQSYVFMADNDGVPGIWRTDGTVDGTINMVSLGMGVGDGSGSACRTDDKVYLVIGGQAWSSNGMLAGTMRLPALDGVEFVHETGTGCYFIHEEIGAGGARYGYYDSVAGTTNRMTQILPSPADAELEFINGKLYVSGSIDLANKGTYVSDGTEAGTAQLADTFIQLLQLGDRLLAYDHSNLRLSTLDESGFTVLLEGAAESGAPALARSGDRLYFKSKGFGGGSDLVVTDGTVAGTKRIKSFDQEILELTVGQTLGYVSLKNGNKSVVLKFAL